MILELITLHLGRLLFYGGFVAIFVFFIVTLGDRKKRKNKYNF